MNIMTACASTMFGIQQNGKIFLNFTYESDSSDEPLRTKIRLKLMRIFKNCY